MTPEKNVKLSIVENDTLPIPIILKYRDDNGISLVPDGWTATMHVSTGAGVVNLAGVAQGDSSGRFNFPIVALANLSGRFRFDLDVDDGSNIFTVAMGTLEVTPEVGA